MDFNAVCKNCMNKCCDEARPPLSRKRAATISHYLKAEGLALSLHDESYSYPEEY